MNETDLSANIPHWIPLSTQLSTALRAIDHQSFATSLQSDLNKLRDTSHLLETFNQTILDSIAINHNEIWHELRNLVSIIIGYCDLIQEQTSHSTPHQLQRSIENLLHLCQQLLEHDQPPDDYVAATQQRLEPKISGAILLVDNKQESREILRRYLQQEHHQVFEAENSQQMFTLLASRNIDLILLDIALPEMHNDALLLQLKHNEKLRATPVIVISGNKNTERAIHCIEAGAEEYLLKPINPALLQARINAAVERKRWHDKEQLYRVELEKNQDFIRKVFGRYLSDEIVSTLLENPDGLDLGGSQRKVTILMADIRDFTTIAEHLAPATVVRLLNIYLGTQCDIIMQHHGTVDEFIGDAILAIFGAPISREDDSFRAIQCALDMQAAMAAINHRNRSENLPEIAMGISINTGMVVAGNIGSEKRAKYGVVGHTVNQTARIEEHCEAGKILISEATLNDCKAMLSIGKSLSITAKGILKAINVYELTGIAPNE
ncbi:MAG: adenylate/guanylate cyclase domain-containing protein [Spongiibacteraceae bacterium]